jgi:NitT/TauT family transport system permease protein
MFWGFLYGATSGIVAGFILGGSPFLARLIDPFITALYSLPKIALAPLFVALVRHRHRDEGGPGRNHSLFLVFWNTSAGVREPGPELLECGSWAPHAGT